MKITTQVVTTDPNYPYNETQAANQVLAALGGDTSDSSTATVQKQSTTFIVNVELQQNDAMHYTADGAAQQCLAALAGNPTKDTCIVNMNMPSTVGHAGK